MNDDQIIHLYQQTFNAWNVVLMVSTWIGLRMVREVLPEVFRRRPESAPLWQKLPRRLMPVYPVFICTFFYVLVPGPWLDPSLGLGQRALLGVMCGFVAGHSHAVLVRLLPQPMRQLLVDGIEARKPQGGTDDPAVRPRD